MFLAYSIRYSGRNIVEIIKNLKPEQYHKLLVLENRLLELAVSPSDEQSQPINFSDMEIVETFNEKDGSDIRTFNNIPSKNIKKNIKTMKSK